MSADPLNVVSGGLTGDAALDTATSRAILQRVDAGELPATLQVGMPHRVVAFGKHDSLSPRFSDATQVAVDHGFDTTVRIAGGRAVVFHPGTIRFAWTVPEDDPATTMHARFATLAGAVVETLDSFDVATRIGELPEEYCAGSYSVHLTHGGKVMGVGQRLARHAAQVGGMIVVNDPDTINAVLGPIYRVLGLSFDPRATGAISDVASLDADAVSMRFVDVLSSDGGVVSATIDGVTQTLAASFRTDHVPQHLRERAERP